MGKDNGGPAFPMFGVNCVRVEMDGTAEYEPQQISEGMTLRDYFAAKFLCGRASVPGRVDPAMEAEFAYRLADAMLAERAQ